MKLYVVGGAVRDALLGLPATDRDWVAVGATPDELVALGYRPVGRDFPVFLHPQTGEEVALARTERKSGRGYHGFTFHASPQVTLEEDLARRDLTINAMARDEAGRIIDPFGGQRDLRERVLRHVSPAFVEDPVRLLRVARLSARFTDFRVAPETMGLLKRMVDDGEVDALVAERVWQELSRGLMESRPSRMLEVLRDTGALDRLLPGVRADDRRRETLDRCAAASMPLPVRTACLLADADSRESLVRRWKLPRDCAELVTLMPRERESLRRGRTTLAAARVALLDRCDAWRRPERFEALLDAADCLAPGEFDTAGWRRTRAAAAAVDTASVAGGAAAAGARGPEVGAAVRAARIAAVEADDGTDSAEGPKG